MVVLPFLLIACLLASFASGVIGSYVVVKRMVFLSGSIAHSVLGGMGFFLWLSRTQNLLWLRPIYGAFLSAILSALLMGWIHRKYKQRKDAIIASIWSTGMSIGVIFISLTPGYNVELSNFLFGNLLWITSHEIFLLLLLDLFILLSVGIFYNPLLAIALDEEQAKLQKISVDKLYFFLLTLVAISIVLLIQMIGIILVIALLTLPAMIASHFTKHLMVLMGTSILFALFFSFSGVFFSFFFDVPTGSTIALFCSLGYFLLLASKKRLSTKKSLP